MLLYEMKNIIKIFYEMENELIIHEWLEYNPEDQDNTILLILQNIYNVFLIHPVEKLIVKTNQTKGVFSPNIQKYIKEVQFPRLITDTKLRYIATIKSNDKTQSLGTTLWQSQLQEEANIIIRDVENEEESNIIIHDVESEEEARDWLKSIT